MKIAPDLVDGTVQDGGAGVEAAIGRPRGEITRQSLLDGSHLAYARANPYPGMPPHRSDAELEASLAEVLAGRAPDRPIWVFGYGSLIWNPAFLYAERTVALVRGWHRRFCLWMPRSRGTPDYPGLMLALDRGGCCRGVAFRLDERAAAEELLLLWRREMLSGAYHARWVGARTAEGDVRAIVFVANRSHSRFTGALPPAEVAERLALAHGARGSCADYFFKTVDHLAALGFHDASLERLRDGVIRNMEARRPRAGTLEQAAGRPHCEGRPE